MEQLLSRQDFREQTRWVRKPNTNQFFLESRSKLVLPLCIGNKTTPQNPVLCRATDYYFFSNKEQQTIVASIDLGVGQREYSFIIHTNRSYDRCEVLESPSFELGPMLASRQYVAMLAGQQLFQSLCLSEGGLFFHRMNLNLLDYGPKDFLEIWSDNLKKYFKSTWSTSEPLTGVR